MLIDMNIRQDYLRFSSWQESMFLALFFFVKIGWFGSILVWSYESIRDSSGFGKTYVFNSQKNHLTQNKEVFSKDTCRAFIVKKSVYFNGAFYNFNLLIDSVAIKKQNKEVASILTKDTLSYFGVSQSLEKSLIGLDSILKDFDLLDKVNFLLSMCQQEKYIDDRDAYGEEVWLSPEATLAAKGSDCDDKSILFAFLVKRMLNLDVYAIVYPKSEHMNIAIYFPEELKDGEMIIIDEQKYLIADPSYLWAELGEQMEGVDIQEEGVRVIKINHPNVSKH
ncbi:hypothetical protein [Phaeodactylibacter xiamenensis]|uniref:hypothetical protein n=1 Tax=Phaeodactylibacter xiamenensis TaxID=1524460 RepID=UPI0024A8F204|nr:hypothetical protein [Phaeodactylibacter xiamenensis]